jgi:hypothetical protein
MANDAFKLIFWRRRSFFVGVAVSRLRAGPHQTVDMPIKKDSGTLGPGISFLERWRASSSYNLNQEVN